MKQLFLLVLLLLFSECMFSQTSRLQSGPMVGYGSKREVALWVQTVGPASVQFRYWPKGKKELAKVTEKVKTRFEDAFTAEAKASLLDPGVTYAYEVLINDTVAERPYALEFKAQSIWEYKTDPPSFTVALGSCVYISDSLYDRPGKAYGGEYGIFEKIAEKNPDLMLWLGDNTYLRPADWNDQSGVHYRNTHTRSIPEMQELLGHTHNYAIWDDHDYGPNDVDRSYYGKHWTKKAFDDFWANPTEGHDLGIATTFIWNDVQFWMLDNRFFRSPKKPVTGKRAILGEEQMQWLIESLQYSKANFKVIAMGGQVINPTPIHENYAVFYEERAKLLNMIDEAKIEGVFFLSGDRHHTILSKLDRPDDYPLYDLTCSPLTSTAYYPAEDENPLRVPNTEVGERNFAVITFKGSWKERQMEIQVFDNKGKKKWERSITKEELSRKEK